MTRVIEVLQTILPVMIMLCIGMICRSRQLISREGINALKSVAVNIALPAVSLSRNRILPRRRRGRSPSPGRQFR